MNATPLATGELVAALRPHLPDGAGEPRLSPIPTGKFNDSYYVSTDAGEFVLRVAPPSDAGFLFYEKDMMRQEPGIHRLLREKTSAPVARLLAFDDSRETIPRDFLLMERLPGASLAEAPVADPARTLREVGAALAEAHSLTAKRYGYLGEHRPMAPAASWGEAFEVMWNKMIDDIVACGHYDEDEARMMRGLLDERRALFDHDPPASLLHMDVWAQNILADRDGRLTGLVDWDRALWGDPEIEFSVLDYCGVSRPPFWEGYGRERDESPEAQIRLVFYLLYEVQKYIVIRQARQGDAASARACKRQTMSLVHQSFR